MTPSAINLTTAIREPVGTRPTSVQVIAVPTVTKLDQSANQKHPRFGRAPHQGDQKIACGRKHFETIGVDYDVVTSLAEVSIK